MELNLHSAQRVVLPGVDIMRVAVVGGWLYVDIRSSTSSMVFVADPEVKINIKEEE